MRLLTAICILLSLIPHEVLAETFTLYLTRHYEKQHNVKNPSLTEVGVTRSLMLRDFLKDKNIKTIYTTDYNRTRETASPVINSYFASVELYNPRELAALSARLLKSKNNALIVGHSNTTPELLAHLTGITVTIAENDYGALYSVTFNDNELVKYQKRLITSKSLSKDVVD